MAFFTKIPILKAQNPISYDSTLLLMGSCFSDNIGAKCSYFQFQSLSNPFGVLFHPIAIETILLRAVEGKPFSEEDLFFYQERYHNFALHSSWSSTDKETILAQSEAMLQKVQQQLRDATHIIITLGTSWVYEHLESKQIVANCHKVPQKQFSKRLLAIEETKQSLRRIQKAIQKQNAEVQLIYTVSPVRHLKDGHIENTRSKARLIEAIQQQVEEVANTHYFPSYEILLDELRDYRFYKEDMLHPSAIAVSHIWEAFCHAWMVPEAGETMRKVAAIQKQLAHRSSQPNSEAHRKMLANTAQKIRELQKQFPHVFVK